MPLRLTDEQRLLAQQYLPLWKSLSRRAGKQWPLLKDELTSGLALALVSTASSHDPARGVKFATHYHHRARWAIKDVLKGSLPKGFRSRPTATGVRSRPPEILSLRPCHVEATLTYTPINPLID